MPQPQGSRRVLLGFGWISFCYFSYAGLFGTYAPLWFQSLGFSTLAIGTLASLQSVTRIIGPYAWGALADHTGQRLRWLRWSCGLCLVCATGFFLTESYAAVAVVMVLLFLATSGVVPISEAALSQWLTKEGELDAARYGRVRLWGSVGFIVSVMCGGYLLDAWGVKTFPAMVVLALAALLFAASRLRLGAEAPKVAGAHEKVVGAWAVLRQAEVAWFFLGVFFTVLAHTALYAFFSLYLASLGYSKLAVGMVWVVGVLAEIVWFWFQGRWLHWLPMHGWLTLAGVVACVRFAVVAALGEHSGLLLVLQLTHAITFAVQHTACTAVVNKHFSGHLRGRGQALYAVLGYGLSGMVGGVCGGVLTQHWGFEAVFWAASASAAVGAVCSWRAHRAQANSSPPHDH
jgi:PPP family 3-phenylpropionic acid transporter